LIESRLLIEAEVDRFPLDRQHLIELLRTR
jgi:hypothetical protein